MASLFDTLGENAVVTCHASGKILRLKKARKHNQGGAPCEDCLYRKRCNQSPDKNKKQGGTP